MGLFSSIVKGVGAVSPDSWVSAGAGLLGGVLNRNANSAAAAQANAWNVENYQHRYQWSIEDMKKAGLNPILAATQGVGGSVQGASALGSSIGNSLGSDFAAGSNSAAARQQANTAADIGKSTIALNTNSAAKYAADADAVRQGIEFNREYFPYEKSIKSQTVDNLKKQGEVLDKELQAKQYQYDFVLPSLVNLYQNQGLAAASSASYNAAMASQANANTDFINAKSKDYKDYGLGSGSDLYSTIGRIGARVLDRVGLRYNTEID